MAFAADWQYTATKFQLHQFLTLTKQEKRLAKRLRITPPKDLERTRNLPRCLGARLSSPGGRRFSRPLRSGKSPDLVFLHRSSASLSYSRYQAPQKQRLLAANQQNSLRNL